MLEYESGKSSQWKIDGCKRCNETEKNKKSVKRKKTVLVGIWSEHVRAVRLWDLSYTSSCKSYLCIAVWNSTNRGGGA
jgi:hypothetical protein